MGVVLHGVPDHVGHFDKTPIVFFVQRPKNSALQPASSRPRDSEWRDLG